MIAELIRAAKLAYYRWALYEMGPCHADAAYVILKIQELEQHAKNSRLA
jgi:hypothetical protein